MGIMDIDSAVVTDLDNKTTSYAAGQEPWNKNLRGFNIDSKSTDVNSYICDFDTWHGLYRNIAEWKASVDTFCRWIVGRKLIMDGNTTKTVSRIKGIGVDDFRKILLNQKRTAKMCGDSYASIVKDKAKRWVNLKPLDPGTIRIDSNLKGIIKRYVQVVDKSNIQSKILDSWKPHEMFHLANNRIANEIHGIPDVESLQNIIKWRHQVMNTYSVILHRYMKPTYFYETDTDDPVEIEAIKNKIDNAIKNFENVVLPKGALDEVKQVKTAQFSALDPMPWLTFLKKYFILVTGVPDIVQGESRESAISSGELNYISYKERIKQEQEDYILEIKSQLGLDVGFEEPREITIEAEKDNTEKKDKPKENKTKEGEKK